MAARLAATVYVTDPMTHRPVRLDPGTLPEQRLAALVRNPAAWVGRELPDLPSGDGHDGDSGDKKLPDPEAEADGDASTKLAAKKAATRPARGRKAAAEGGGSQ